MINWHEFLLLYILFTISTFSINFKIIKHSLPNLLRIILSVAIVLFLFDFLAWDNAFWDFPILWDVYFLQIPLENIIFVIMTTILLLILYLKIDSYFDD